ncbi:hypothetical protein F5879DRAFT_1075666 [Lentinula edodes]|nr:hypothetical protein F5879DRAFT_1075666 [Lentinula edodes]
MWFRNLIQYGSDGVYDLFAASDDAGESYMVLLKQALLLLLQEEAPNVQYFRYLIFSIHSFHPRLKPVHQRVHSIPAFAWSDLVRLTKSSPALPLLITLSALPFSVLEAPSAGYTLAVRGLFVRLLAVPLLPGRLPLRTLACLSSHLPLTKMNVLYAKPSGDNSNAPSPLSDMASGDALGAKIHLMSNLLAFMPPSPRYSKQGLH